MLMSVEWSQSTKNMRGKTEKRSETTPPQKKTTKKSVGLPEDTAQRHMELISTLEGCRLLRNSAPGRGFGPATAIPQPETPPPLLNHIPQTSEKQPDGTRPWNLK